MRSPFKWLLLFWTAIKVKPSSHLHLLAHHDLRLNAPLMHSYPVSSLSHLTSLTPVFCNLENSIGLSITFSLYFSLYSCSRTARKYSLPQTKSQSSPSFCLFLSPVSHYLEWAAHYDTTMSPNLEPALNLIKVLLPAGEGQEPVSRFYL